MSAKGEEKHFYHQEKTTKQTKLHTSEKIGHKEIKEEKYLEDDDEDNEYKYYAESKTEKIRKNSSDNSHIVSSISHNNKSVLRDISNDSIEEAEEADREFELLMRKPNEGTIALPSNSQAQAIMDGFQINSMNMRDANTGETLWVSRKWTQHDMLSGIMEAHIPKEILDCEGVSREINFSSREQINDFRLEQRIFIHGSCLEEWSFHFGFVIPGSTNSWQQTIYAASRNKMIPAEVLSGNTTIETSFYDGNLLIAKSLIRLYYE
mmetsp:Transcript_24805/g.25434  ORF Transcript_24805/g.25434 Transcript_24805/m.25434 type:complete len:264 (-) Transcript_24805:129-920(-)